jgi:hypothetical protein
MAIRSFGVGVQTIGAASQPAFGTTLTAASTFSVDRYKGTNTPGTTTPPITLVVASSLGMKVNDAVLVGLKANFTPANALLLDRGLIAAVVDATHITVQGLTQNHASGEYVVLNEPAAMVQITPVTTTANIYVGNASTVSSTDSSTFDVIGKNATTIEPTYWSLSPPTGLGDSYNTSEFWLNGTAGDTFVARFTQI